MVMGVGLAQEQMMDQGGAKMDRVLDIYLCNNLVGTLTQDESGDLEFVYDHHYLKTAKHGISLSLPLSAGFSDEFSDDFFKGIYRRKNVKAFFSGLLPEESVRERLAGYLGVSETNPFALLEIVGGDCAGALALYPQGEKPSEETREVENLDDTKLKEILNLIKRRPMLAGDDGYRLSLAGAQDKLAVGFQNGRVQLIKGGAPTTHILKPIIERIKDSAHNELFCMKLARRMGIDVPEAMLHFVDDTPYYLVERYDRTISDDGSVKRIHQEDFCQALGIAPELKYEREGGPTIAVCQEIIAKYTARPAVDQIKLLNIIIFNYLIGNADAHGKNFSLVYKGNKPELAPAYDLLSTAVYPDLSEKTAMKIGGKYRPKDIYRRHFYRLVSDTKAAQSSMSKQIEAMVNKIEHTAEKLKTELEADGLSSQIFNDIIAVIKERSKRLKE
jgi:serine/threonine-protein kinase HipA